MKRILCSLLLVLGLVSGAAAQQAIQHVPGQLSMHSHTSAATLTITPPAGSFVYIIGIDIANCAGASAVTAAAPTFITTTGLGNSPPQYMLGSGTTAGACQQIPITAFMAPIKSAQAGQNVTFVLPAFATNQTVSLNVYFYFGQ